MGHTSGWWPGLHFCGPCSDSEVDLGWPPVGSGWPLRHSFCLKEIELFWPTGFHSLCPRRLPQITGPFGGHKQPTPEQRYLKLAKPPHPPRPACPSAFACGWPQAETKCLLILSIGLTPYVQLPLLVVTTSWKWWTSCPKCPPLRRAQGVRSQFPPWSNYAKIGACAGRARPLKGRPGKGS